jgi:hypothetical protein
MIGLDVVFKKTPIMNPKKWTIAPGDAFEGATFTLEIEIVKF